jgi:flagellar basal body rod protein FlgF
MGTAFSNALSGLTANAQAIDAVSGNLANMNTTGFKANQVSFEDLVSESLGGSSSTNQVGGSTVARSNATFSQGAIAPTGQPYDAAIQGNGFFVLQTATGQQAFLHREFSRKLGICGDHNARGSKQRVHHSAYDGNPYIRHHRDAHFSGGRRACCRTGRWPDRWRG